jgi:hypothetical protein
MSRSRKLKRVALVLIGLFCVLWLIIPANARAGTYTVIECHPQDYGVNTAPDAQPIGSFFNDGASYMTWSIAGCSQQGNNYGLWLQAVGNAWGGSVYTTLGISAPPGAYINGGSFHYSGWGDPSFDSWGHGAYFLSNAGTVIQSWGGGDAGQPRNEDEQIPATGGSGKTLRVDQSCPQTPGNWCLGEDNISIKNIILLLVDSSPPSIDGMSGSLVDSTAHGLASLRLQASDRGSGIQNVSIEANGEPIPPPSVNCSGWRAGDGFAVRTRPCGDLDSTIGVDTEHTPWRDGSNTLRVCVSDLSTGPEPAYTTCEQRNVQVDNSCPDSQGASGEASSLSAGLADPKSGALSKSRAARSTDGIALRGTVQGGGSPVRGASVCVYETVDEPAGISQLVQVAKSTSNGEFGVNLPPGPSRTFQVAYRYGDHQIGSPSMHLDSSVVPTLGVTKKKLSNGHSVGFRGQLPGPHADGVAVTLQARVGKKWRTFKQVTSERGGSFQGKYRFTQTHGSVLYVFRALVKKQGSYPYSEGASRKRKVLVHG